MADTRTGADYEETIIDNQMAKGFPDYGHVNNPVALGYYDWYEIQDSNFEIEFKSDSNRRMYGFKLQ